MNKSLPSIFFGVTILFVAATAKAEEPSRAPASYATSTEAEPASTEWYGYQTLIADGAVGVGLVTSMALASTSRSTGPATGVLVGTLSSYALTAPIIHFAHGEPGRGLTSLGLRVGTPTLAAFVGMAAASQCNSNHEPWNFCRLEGLVAGAGVGMLVATVIDASVVAWKKTAPSEKRRSVVLDASLTPSGATLGASGRF